MKDFIENTIFGIMIADIIFAIGTAIYIKLNIMIFKKIISLYKGE